MTERSHPYYRKTLEIFKKGIETIQDELAVAIGVVVLTAITMATKSKRQSLDRKMTKLQGTNHQI